MSKQKLNLPDGWHCIGKMPIAGHQEPRFFYVFIKDGLAIDYCHDDGQEPLTNKEFCQRYPSLDYLTCGIGGTYMDGIENYERLWPKTAHEYLKELESPTVLSVPVMVGGLLGLFTLAEALKRAKSNLVAKTQPQTQVQR